MDNSSWLSLLALLNTIYIAQQYQQNRKLNKWIGRMEEFLEEFIIMRTQHKTNHGDSGFDGKVHSSKNHTG